MILFSDNIISLRTAVFEDDGVVGTLVLLPPEPDRRPDGHLHRSVCWVYRRRDSLIEESAQPKLREWKPECVFENLQPMNIRLDPTIAFLWSDTGNSVAVVVDGQPMGFISEHKHCPFSRGEKAPPVNQNLWDEEAFQKLFRA